jgi:hypothetical protein
MDDIIIHGWKWFHKCRYGFDMDEYDLLWQSLFDYKEQK